MIKKFDEFIKDCNDNLCEELEHNLFDQEMMFEMANLPPKRTGLKYQIWYSAKIEKHKPRIKVDLGDGKALSIQIEDHKVIGAVDKISSKDLNNILYLFPQGIIKPPNFRPIEFQTGLSFIAEKAAKRYGKVNLMPIAVNYFFLRDNRPEVWVEFGDIISLDNGKVNRKEYSDYLAKELEKLCDKQMYDISQANFGGYETLFQQKLKWYRAFEQHLKRIRIRKNKEED